MATKGTKSAAEVAVVVPSVGAVALPADLAAELAGYAKDQSSKERPKVGRISLKSGMMAYNGNDIDGNSMPAVILFAGHRNVYYEGMYDPDNIVNPTCFALAEDGAEMTPHPNVTKPVGHDCKSCPKGQWGSAVRNGKPSRGKACKETRRLVLMPTSALKSPDDVKTAELAILDVPVTSVGNYGNLVNQLDTLFNLPTFAVITQVAVRHHKVNQFEVIFSPLDRINDAAVVRAIMTRRDEAARIALTPYEGAGGEADPDAGKQKPEGKTKF